jgi:transcriptional regulator EpsA
MEQLVILSKLEQEYLLRVIESALHVRDLRGFFLWTQGQVQALLPHEVMVCMQFGPDDQLLRLECLHGTVQAEATLARLCDPADGLALRIAQRCREGGRLPCMSDLGDSAPDAALAPFRAELGQLGFDNLIVHGSGRLAGGSTMFLLLRLPLKPGARHAYFLELLLPYLHMALLRLAQPGAASGETGHAAILRPLSARETEILAWVREGKSNYEVGRILGISALTVKNHLQRIYKTLGVSNRTHALSRCMALRLLAPAPDRRSRDAPP